MADLVALHGDALTARESKVLDAVPRHAWTGAGDIARAAGLTVVMGELTSLEGKGLARRYRGLWRRTRS